MKRRLLFLLCIVFTLTGCQVKQNNSTEDNGGVYLQKIDESEISGQYNPLASYSYGLLHYDDKMYTSTLQYSSTDKNTLDLDSILGDELEHVSGNHDVFWSTDSDELSEVTYNGTLYQVKGYDDSFRIAVYYETTMPLTETYYHLTIFDHLNDIYLKKASELFDDRLHLSEAIRVEGALNGKEVLCDLSENTVVEEFLVSLYDSAVLDVSESVYSALEPNRSCILSFYGSAGLVTDVMVYEDGYAAIEYNGNKVLAVELDREICKSVINVIQYKINQ